jgi:hypothetical protein
MDISCLNVLAIAKMRLRWNLDLHFDLKTVELMDRLPGLAGVRIDLWDAGPDGWELFLVQLSKGLRSMRKIILGIANEENAKKWMSRMS